MRKKLEYISFLLFAFNCFIPVVIPDFRFCYKGPHRMNELDCPGGFIAKQKIPLTCKYYARTVNISVSTAKFIGDVCDATGTTMDINVESTDEDDMSTFGDTLHQVSFEIDDLAILDPTDIGGKYEPEDVCFTSCLEEWQDPGAVEDEAFITDGRKTLGVALDTIHVAAQLNKEVFLALIEDDEDYEDEKPNDRNKRKIDPFTNDIDDGEHLRIVKLLAKSMRVTVAGCSPYVDEEFFRQVLKAMIFLSKKNETIIQDVTPAEYKNINSALNRCFQKRNLGFTLNGTICEGQAKVDGIFYFKKQEFWKYRKTAKSYRFRHNPYIEAAWNSIEFVLGYCFESFVYNILDFHTYQVSLEGLFTGMVLNHWEVPSALKHNIFWNNVLQTFDVNVTMRNLDACVIGGTTMSPFSKRIERPYVTQDFSVSKLPDPDEPLVPLEKGWKKSQNAYWEWYERQGGFKEISKSFGTCINEPDADSNRNEMDDIVTTHRDKECPDGGNAAPRETSDV